MAKRTARPTGTGRRAPRRRLLILSLLLAALALDTSASPADGACPGGDFAAPSPPALVSAVFCEVNSMRATQKLRRLRHSRRLSLSARRHARDMLRRRYFSHRSPEGTTVRTRIRGAGYGANGEQVFVGEILGLGLAGTAWALTPRGLVWTWFASPSHRRVLFSRRWRELGIGSVFFSWGPIQAFVVVADFARRKGTLPTK